MGMEKLLIYEGDDRPSLYLRAYCVEQGCYLNLSESTTKVYFSFRKAGASTLIVDAQECTKVLNGETGWVQFDWPATALDDLDAGVYEAEVYIDFNGEIITGSYYAWVDEPDAESKNLMFKLRKDF